MICAACGADLGRRERVGRRDACPRCEAELRTCRQCRFYEPTAADGCREPHAERVAEKSRANFCDYFAVGEPAAPEPTRSAPDTRAALDRLFARR
jgi:hypothetical protein